MYKFYKNYRSKIAMVLAGMVEGNFRWSDLPAPILYGFSALQSFGSRKKNMGWPKPNSCPPYFHHPCFFSEVNVDF